MRTLSIFIIASFGYANSLCIDPFLGKLELRPDEVSINFLTATKLRPSQIATSPLEPLMNRALSEVEDKLKNLKVVKESTDHGAKTANQTAIITLSDGTKGLWKPHQRVWHSNYRAEVLAYEIDQIFGFQLVPPTVERQIGMNKGSVQLFRKTGSKAQKRHIPSIQLHKQSLFDFILDNRDRHHGNYLVSAETSLISIDHGLSFTRLGNNEKGFFERRESINFFLKSQESKTIIEKMKSTDLVQLKEEVAEYLGSEDAERFIRRVKFIIRYTDGW